MKTPAEIDDLKRQWENDPCWDIEETAGFEEHRDELRSWRDKYEDAERVRIEALYRDNAERAGLPGNVAAGKFVQSVEDRFRDEDTHYETVCRELRELRRELADLRREIRAE